jgi:prepilin-type N-terminal cleavage/methylation domain-containing protein
MNLRAKHRAFTLIELLTVMAIITILIGILTPALQTARDNGKKVAIRAVINAMEVGLVAFSNDEGGFPPSNPVFYAGDLLNPDAEMQDWEVGTVAQPLQGAHLVMDALVGRDLLGYDPKAPPFGPGGSFGDVYDRWDSANDRRLPYLPADGVDVTSNGKPPDDAFGGNPTILEVHPRITGSGQQELLCRVFRDKFGWPILYYRASPTANQNTPIVQTVTIDYSDGVYDGFDNEHFTSYDYGNTPTHKIVDAIDALPDNPPYGTALETKFAEFIRSIRASTYDQPPDDTIIRHPRPVKFNRFVILSAGKDGIYGTLDDVANYSVFSEER